MHVAIDESGSAPTLVLKGRLDISGADVVALPLAALSGKRDNIFVDMAGVTFIASIGLRHFVASAKALERRGGHLVLLNPVPAVAEMIAMTGLSDLIRIEYHGENP
jgi:anti-anti-sigma factor